MFVLLTALLFSTIIIIPLNAEFIFTKTGEIIEGTIVSDSANSVMLRTADKKQIKIMRDNIMRILYTKLKMGKVFIQKRDGKAIMAFIVDEDQESYTCRKELYSPEEFNLKRSEVLFMAEKNPSGLQPEGDIGTDRVSLTWLAPYGEVRKYNVYIKKGENSKYELADSSKSKSITIKKLESNTTYYLIVTGVDNEDYESSPSNELKITTKNIPPEIPLIISSVQDASGGKKFVWDPSNDHDGKVVKYRIYGNRNDKRELVAEVRSTEYFFKDPESYDYAELTAVDDRGDESEPESMPTHIEYTGISFYPGIIYPMGKFGKVTGPGFGASVSYTLNNYFYNRLVAGIEAGFYSFAGKDALESEYKKTETVYMAPLFFTAGYSFIFKRYFSVMPYAGLGITYFYADYIKRDKITYNESSENISEIGPSACTGIAGSYSINKSLSAVLRVSMGYLVGSDSGFYAGCDIGCMYRI
jgi:hypothetical protein